MDGCYGYMFALRLPQAFAKNIAMAFGSTPLHACMHVYPVYTWKLAQRIHPPSFGHQTVKLRRCQSVSG
jgi:hypothetical protein